MASQTVLDVYARVSRLGDDRQRSTEGQADDCTARVAERGAQVGELHIDSGRSAWNPRVRRPGWDRLMDRLERGVTGGVVVFDLARFSRRPIEGERLIAAAERGLLVLDSEGEYDLTSANGKKQFRDQLATAAYESDRLSTRVKRGKRVKAMNGEPNHSSRPFGFEPDGLTPRPAETAVLRELVGRLLDGESLDTLVIELNERGVTTSTGGAWTSVGLRQVLVRPRNAGRIEHNGVTVGRLPGEPVLDEDTFERMCALFASRRRGRPNSPTYLCSGVVCCGRCGHTLTGRPRAHLTPYADGSVRRQYWCQPRAGNGGGCGRITIDQRELDWHVRLLVTAILADPGHAEAVESAAAQIGKRRRDLDAELSECEHLAAELSARLGRREITLSRYDAAVEPLDKRITELHAERDQLDAEPTVPVTAETVAASEAGWRQRWDAALVPERRGLIRQAMRGRRLVVDPGAVGRFDPSRIRVAKKDHPIE